MHQAILISATVLILCGIISTIATYRLPDRIIRDFERAEREENE
jgi:hypothetical protein